MTTAEADRTYIEHTLKNYVAPTNVRGRALAALQRLVDAAAAEGPSEEKAV